MKQLITKLLMLTAVLSACTNLYAYQEYDFEVDGIYYNITSSTEKTVEVTYDEDIYGYRNSYSGNIVIPEQVIYNSDTYSVTSIGDEAFYECYKLASVTIPNSVTTIGDSAFDGCKNLTSVTIPNSVTSIGSLAFYGCSGLKSVYISDLSAWCKIEFGGWSANPLYYAHLYLNGKLVTDLTIPDGVTEIKDYAFYGNSNLTSVTIPNSVTSIGDYAFSDCTGLTSVTIPNSVTAINDGVFNGCSGLTSVTIPNSITSIGDRAFDGCTGLKELTIEECETTLSLGCNYFDGFSTAGLGEGLFYDCPLETVYLGRNISYKSGNQAGYSPFYKTPITSLAISNSVTSIGNYLFRGCTGLTSVTIPNSVTSIGDCAFSECSNTKELVIEDGEKILELGDNRYDGLVFCYDGLFYDCPLETVYLGRNLNYDSSNYSGYSPFYETSITTLTIGNTVTSIGDHAFDGCSGLTFVTMGNSVTSIGYEAFNNCSKLTSVTIPSSVISIGGRAFCNCTGLESVNISDLSAWCKISFSGEDSNPLYYAHNLYLNGELVTDLTIPDGITVIKGCAFIGCRGLTSVTTPNNVTAINGSAFKNCSDLASITIPNSVTTIGGSAFGGCNLSHISFEYNKDIYVGTLAEDNPNAIADIYVPNDVIWFSNENPYSNFNYNLYFDNDLVTEYTFPKDALEIQSNVFKGCISIKDITVPDNIIIIGSAAFKDSGLESLILGRKVTKIEENAFNCNNLMKISSLNTYYPIIKVSSFSDYSYQNAIVNVPKESLKDYKESEWGNFQNLNGKTFGNIEYITRGEVKVTISGRNIIVDGADDLLKRVYNLSGQLIYSGMDDTIPISTSGIYLINIADKTYKLTIK